MCALVAICASIMTSVFLNVDKTSSINMVNVSALMGMTGY